MRRFLYGAAAFLVICGTILGVFRLSEYLGVNDSAAMRRLTFHDYYDQDGKIDVLFLGSSQVFHSIDTGIFDEKLGKNTFALGTSSQRLNISRFLLEDAAKRNPLEHVYVYLGYRQAMYTRDTNVDLHNLYPVTDSMKPSLDKFLLLARLTEPDEYMNDILPARRNLANLFDPASIAATLEIKASDRYKSHDYSLADTAAEYYAGKGHVAGKIVMEKGKMVSVYTADPLSTDKITETWENSLKEIVSFCREKGIELTFFAPPVSSCVMEALQDQDAFNAHIEELLAGTGVEYLDFSLLKKEYWGDDADLYQDESHLNQFGAEKFSELFADYINGELTDEIFCGSVEERLASLEPAFHGVSIKEMKTEAGNIKQYQLLGNPMDKLLYKVVLYPGDGQAITLQDYDKNRYIDINEGTPGSLRISVRMEDNEKFLELADIKL